jgi:hypothetical protein
MTDANYRYLSQAGRIEVVRRACRNTPALIACRSLPRRFKERAEARYGKLERDPGRFCLAARVTKDLRAERFFAAHTFDEHGTTHLTPRKQAEYTMNASVLNALPGYYSERVMYIRERGNASIRRVWPEVCQTLKDIQGELGCNLPKCPVALKRKMEEYQKEGYRILISGKYQNKNAIKAKSDEQESLMRELAGNGRNMDNETVANLYNLVAERMGWPAVTGATVANYKKRMQETYAKRHGKNMFMNTKSMQVKRSRPSTPLFYWSVDGWDTELLYQSRARDSRGNEITTYHNRPTVVTILDPFNDYIIGYAIGTHEHPALIRQAFRNAFGHVRELFGAYYKPWQIQTDNYGGAELKEFYRQCAHYYTPAAVGNAKAKPVEPFFGRINRKYFRLFANSSGYGIKSRQAIQPSEDYIRQHKKSFPGYQGCVEQIEQVIQLDRTAKRSAFVDKWNAAAETDRLPFEWGDYLALFGEATPMAHKLHGHGITLQLNGEKYVYDSFDPGFREHGHTSFILRYDPADMDRILAVENAGTREKPEEGGSRFTLERKYVQPMALKDRKPGDAEELARVRGYNAGLVEMYAGKLAHSEDTVRELFANNAGRLDDTLTKLVLTDSAGRHKDMRNEISGRRKKEAIPIEAPDGGAGYEVARLEESDFLKDF